MQPAGGCGGEICEGGRDSAQLAPVWDPLGTSDARLSHYITGNRKAESISRWMPAGTLVTLQAFCR